MQKSAIRVLTFLATLSLGLVVSFVWYFSYSRSTKEITNISVEPSLESKLTEGVNKSIEPWALKIPPCVGKNPMTYPSSDWKGKGVLSGGVVNRRIVWEFYLIILRLQKK